MHAVPAVVAVKQRPATPSWYHFRPPASAPLSSAEFSDAARMRGRRVPPWSLEDLVGNVKQLTVLVILSLHHFPLLVGDASDAWRSAPVPTLIITKV